MGRIITQVKVTNALDPSKSLEISALVDTGASHVVLPSAWKDSLGALELLEVVECEAVNQTKSKSEIYGPVKIRVGNFRTVYSEVLFIDMDANAEGNYEPLVGYLVLEAIPVAVDMLGHRLVKVRALDLK